MYSLEFNLESLDPGRERNRSMVVSYAQTLSGSRLLRTGNHRLPRRALSENPRRWGPRAH